MMDNESPTLFQVKNVGRKVEGGVSTSFSPIDMSSRHQHFNVCCKVCTC